MFECYFKTKHVDLSNVTIPFIKNNVKVMYPKTTKQILDKFNIETEKSSGINVWKMYDSGNYTDIEKRTEGEVKDCIKIYNNLLNNIY